MSDQVIHALSLPKQINYLHLPVQSGSDQVLRRMNRKYSRTQYLDIIAKIKGLRPGIALGTDLIVGFPGETDQDFEATLDLYRVCDFDISYPAQYSPRPGTLSMRLFADDVPAEAKKARWLAVQHLMEETALRKNQRYIGQTVRVFVERVHDGQLFGTNDELKAVSASGALPEMAGTFVRVVVDTAMTWLLQGKVAGA
jgi:tRNA-2-methylthio-N6-dimethylallyladenosine synthase